jgi:hypothetical protein
VPLTALELSRMVSNVEVIIDFLNVLDGDPDLDGGAGDQDCCEAADDDPASSQLAVRGCGSAWGPGDPEDGEDNGDAELTVDDIAPAFADTWCRA